MQANSAPSPYSPKDPHRKYNRKKDEHGKEIRVRRQPPRDFRAIIAQCGEAWLSEAEVGTLTGESRATRYRKIHAADKDGNPAPLHPLPVRFPSVAGVGYSNAFRASEVLPYHAAGNRWPLPGAEG